LEEVSQGQACLTHYQNRKRSTIGHRVPVISGSRERNQRRCEREKSSWEEEG